ncbi:MAG: sigma-54-dependent Fis family transcriptional regulator [Acidobacteria bacterium]|nr:sigma-54-dependent Fis family transcriptional regulator [Acidobacteriota bacterium]
MMDHHMKGNILVIDDEEVMRDVLKSLLVEEGYQADAVASGEEGLERIRDGFYDCVLLDLMMQGMDGLQTLEEIKRIDPHLVTIIITAYASIENAVQATKIGAFDFITKPFKNEELLVKMKNAIQARVLTLENLRLRRSFKQQYDFRNIVGKSARMQQIFDLIAQVAPSRSTVLIYGESGTGKELVAKAIHNCSSRSDGPFVTVNCGNIPTELLESELFGHVKGAYTGASASKKGLFEVASGGSLFLDEVSTIAWDTQAKLLRVIQEREFRRLGGLESIKVDVRIIAATNSDLQKDVEERRFRDDLFYRLNVISIHLPPLRERKEDISLMEEHFVKMNCEENQRPLRSVDAEAMRALMEYDWPGNVRELENVIERAVVLSPSSVILKDLLPRDLVYHRPERDGKWALPEDGINLKERITDIERNYIMDALRRTDWNQKKAAKLLTMNPTTLNEKIKRLHIKSK